MKYCKLELPYLYLTATNNKGFAGKRVKARWLCPVPKAMKSVVKAKIAQNNSQVSEGEITVKPGQGSIHELIIWIENPFVASVTCSRYQIAFNWSVNSWLQCLAYDEMENISMNEISV